MISGKNLYLLLFFSCICALSTLHKSVQAQHPWAPIGANWTFGMFDIDAVYYTNVSTSYVFSMNWICTRFDTIDGKFCSVIDAFPEKNNDDFLDTLYMYEEDEVVYIRGQDSFVVLYDYNAEPGHCWTVHLGDYFNINLNLMSKDSIVINGKNLKRLIVNYTGNTDTIIEGIGFLNRMIPTIYYCYTFRQYTGLRCYTDSVIGLYKKVNYPCDTGYSHTTIYNPPISNDASIDILNSETIFPNPVENIIFIRNIPEDQYTYTISDIAGRRMDSGYFSGTEINIPIVGIAAGQYVLSLQGSVYSGRKLIRVKGEY